MVYIKTYVKGLDEQIQGGIKEGSVVLVAGGSGSMKSSFVFHLLYEYVKVEEGRAVYLTLEQERETLIEQMRNLGMDIDEIKEDFAIIDIGVLRKELEGFESEDIDWFGAIKTQIKKYKETIDFDILAIDSLDAMYVISQMKNPRNDLFHFFTDLRKLKLTSLLITEMPRGTEEYGKYGVESFLADGIIHLAMERTGRSVSRFISIVKMRGVKHSTDYFPLLVSRNGFEIVIR